MPITPLAQLKKMYRLIWTLIYNLDPIGAETRKQLKHCRIPIYVLYFRLHQASSLLSGPYRSSSTTSTYTALSLDIQS